ncbi:hypothetical protein [Nocardioides daphniae]|uniref:Lipoprotein n=1 Tax=Nocardioides daphniae TaxID=402297 RepID=A0A4V1CWK4_9ACTN|nr:hypothetical protein [Nocardioides daphniae]QCC77577.1 hypothetical protein E2C04_11070 [Nocardioides daphniae]GGD30588.1 hypothetical protein GCM10007231_32560 [Nocardioides daphniae]
MMNLTRSAAIAVFLGLSLVACGSGASDSGEKAKSEKETEPTTFDVAGTISGPGGCGSQANGSVEDGARVTITDNSGKVLAFDELGEGVDVDTEEYMGPCRYDFVVYEVPVGETDVYGLTVGTTSAEPYLFKQDEAGSLSLTLGE